jgi:hypothetical protein
VNAHNLTAINVAQQGSATGIIDGADSLTLNSGQTAQGPNNANLLPATITQEAWVNLSVLPSSRGGGGVAEDITNNGNSTYPNYSYKLDISPTNNACFHWVNTSQTDFVVCGGSTLAANTWYHLAGTYNGSVLKIYVNGVDDTFNTVNPNGTLSNGPGN